MKSIKFLSLFALIIGIQFLNGCSGGGSNKSTSGGSSNDSNKEEKPSTPPKKAISDYTSPIFFASRRPLDGSNEITNFNIWVMDIDGSNPQAITNIGAEDTAPVRSPDGTKILFLSERNLDGSRPSYIGGLTNIWVMNVDGSDLKALTKDPRPTRPTGDEINNVHSTWSPDGTKITFTSNRSLTDPKKAGFADNIWVMDIDGSNPHPLTQNINVHNFSPTWSPDGKIAFVSDRESNGSDKRRVDNHINIWIIDTDGSNLTALTDPGWVNIFPSPAWSPDGTKITFVCHCAVNGRDPSPDNIWVMNKDGSNLRALTKIEFEKANPLSNPETSHPRWSRDGTKIIFDSTRALDGSNLRNEHYTYNVWIMNSDGSNVHPLTQLNGESMHSMNPSF